MKISNVPTFLHFFLRQALMQTRILRFKFLHGL